MMLSISQLADLTGCARKTVKVRCEHLKPVQGERNATLYESKEALPLIYGTADEDTGRIDLARENGLLAREKRLKTNLERQILEGRLIETEAVVLTWQAMLSALRARLLALPVEGAQVAIVSTDLQEIEERLTEIVYEALAELSNDGLPDDIRRRYNQAGDESFSASPETDSYPVGGPVQEAKRGSKCKTRTMAN